MTEEYHPCQIFFPPDIDEKTMQELYRAKDIYYVMKECAENNVPAWFFISPFLKMAPTPRVVPLQRKRKVSRFTVFLNEEDGVITVTCPSLPGCITEGDNEEEAIKNAEEAIKGYLECAKKHGVKLDL